MFKSITKGEWITIALCIGILAFAGCNKSDPYKWGDNYKTFGIKLGSHLSTDAPDWAIHDGGEVSATYALEHIDRSMLSEVLEENEDFRLMIRDSFFGVHEYCKRRFEEGETGYMAQKWDAVKDYLVRTNMNDPATSLPDTFASWLGNPNVDITKEEARVALVTTFNNHFEGSIYDTSNAVGVLFDFVAMTMPDFKGWQDPIWSENEHGRPDLDQDGIDVYTDTQYYDTDMTEMEAWVLGQVELLRLFREELPESVFFIANGTAAVDPYEL